MRLSGQAKFRVAMKTEFFNSIRRKQSLAKLQVRADVATEERCGAFAEPSP